MPSVSSVGKPRLFFSTDGTEAEWRFKEKVVAVIESYLQGYDDLYTFSSKRIRNVVGDPEEVDVAFSTIDNPEEYFSFVQVRDRDNVQGRSWFQQLIGQQSTLNIPRGTMVSTTEFSQPAIRLAAQYGVPLRLLHPASEEETRWYLLPGIGVNRPFVKIAKAIVIAQDGNKLGTFDADAERCVQANIFAHMSQPDEYRLISLSRVFDVDVLQNTSRAEQFWARIPRNNELCKATVTVEYQPPTLSLSMQQDESSGTRMIPIVGIAFYVLASQQAISLPIRHRFKYLDVVSGQEVAQIVIAEGMIGEISYYACLVRHSCDGTQCQLGGAFFR